MTSALVILRTAMLAVALAMTPAPDALAQKADGDPVIDFERGDASMNAAIKAARSTLDLFWAALEKPGTTGGSLKVAIPVDTGGAEHIFLADIQRIGTGRYQGLIANNPVHLRTLRRGDVYQFTDDQISDWLYIRDGLMHGLYTVRVMLPRMPKQQAEALRQRMAPLPPRP